MSNINITFFSLLSVMCWCHFVYKCKTKISHMCGSVWIHKIILKQKCFFSFFLWKKKFIARQTTYCFFLIGVSKSRKKCDKDDLLCDFGFYCRLLFCFRIKKNRWKYFYKYKKKIRKKFLKVLKSRKMKTYQTKKKHGEQ